MLWEACFKLRLGCSRITEEVRAENQQLKAQNLEARGDVPKPTYLKADRMSFEAVWGEAKLESFGELIAKQQQTIQDHEVRGAFGFALPEKLCCVMTSPVRFWQPELVQSSLHSCPWRI